MENKVDEITEFVMERCLWQFHSREWDRKDNINGIFDVLKKILNGEKVATENATLQEKCFYADGKILADQLKEKFSYLNEMDQKEITELLNGIKDKLVDIAITKCRNEELRVPFY